MFTMNVTHLPKINRPTVSSRNIIKFGHNFSKVIAKKGIVFISDDSYFEILLSISIYYIV